MDVFLPVFSKVENIYRTLNDANHQLDDTARFGRRYSTHIKRFTDYFNWITYGQIVVVIMAVSFGVYQLRTFMVKKSIY